MVLSQALEGISAKSYFEFCNLKYSGLKYNGFDQLRYEDLTPAMQLGIRRLMLSLWQTQKITFYYELEYILRCLKNCGVRFRWFFALCDINASFYSNKYLSQKDRSQALLKIRITIFQILNRLFEYINYGSGVVSTAT